MFYSYSDAAVITAISHNKFLI